jgi:hypothetical protein
LFFRNFSSYSYFKLRTHPSLSMILKTIGGFSSICWERIWLTQITGTPFYRNNSNQLEANTVFDSLDTAVAQSLLKIIKLQELEVYPCFNFHPSFIGNMPHLKSLKILPKHGFGDVFYPVIFIDSFGDLPLNHDLEFLQFGGLNVLSSFEKLSKFHKLKELNCDVCFAEKVGDKYQQIQDSNKLNKIFETLPLYLQNLEILTISGARGSDISLGKYISGLSKLQKLDVARYLLSDADLDEISSVPSLKELVVMDLDNEEYRKCVEVAQRLNMPVESYTSEKLESFKNMRPDVQVIFQNIHDGSSSSHL